MITSVGYLIQVELKKQLGEAPADVKTCFVLPPPDCNLSYSEAAEKAFDLALQAMRQISRYPVIAEVSCQRVYMEDTRSLRNSVLLEKDGWKCFGGR